MRKPVFTIVTLFGLVSFRPAAVQSQNSIENDKMRLEIVGLKRWTIPMIQDSLTKYSPHDLLLSHACAAILREKLNFAEADVNIFPGGYDGRSKDLVMVTVVEPQDSQLVSYRPAFTDSVPTRSEWGAALQFIKSRSETFQTVIQRPDQLKTDSARPLAEFLRDHSRASDYSTAVRTLARDKNWENRLVAVVLLRSFAKRIDESANSDEDRPEVGASSSSKRRRARCRKTRHHESIRKRSCVRVLEANISRAFS